MTSAIRTTVLLGALTGLLMLIGGVVGGSHGAEMAFIIALAMNFFSYWFSDKIVLRAYGAQKLEPSAAPELYSIVQELANEAHIPVPPMYMIDTDTPNAFATGRNPNHAAVAVTQGILQICTWSELRGVLAHEISHVRNRDILTSSVAASIAMGITFLARMAAWSGLFFGGGQGGRRNQEENIFGLLAMMILAPLAATLLQLALSRSREYEADRDGARLIGDGEPLASALQKLDMASRRQPMPVPKEMAALFIVNPLNGRRVSFSKWFADHPPTDQRIARLRSRQWAQKF